MSATWQIETAPAQAAVKSVRVVDDRFRPARVTIRAGDAVRWSFARRNRNFHNVTAVRTPRRVSRRAFTSGPEIPGGRRFKRTFRRAGVYSFTCTIHFGMGMRVTVKRRR